MGVLVAASPRGRRSGLLHFAKEGHSVTVLVLPKIWDVEPTVTGEGCTRTVVLRENDSVVLEAEKSFEQFLVFDVQGRIGDAARRARASPSDDPDDSDDPVDPKDDVARDELVRFSATATPGHRRTGSEDLGRRMVDLALLAARVDDGRRKLWQSAGAPDSDGGGSIGRGQETTPKHLLVITQWLFVHHLTSKLRKIRRGYLSIVERTGVIRGRITSRGMIQHASSGLPSIECAHDDFTESRPLYRVLVTALERVASGSLAARYGLTEWGVNQDLMRRAVHLRRQLSQIPGLPLPAAMEEVGRIRLGPLDREWSETLALAEEILFARPPMLGKASETDPSLQWWIDTARLWEKVLEKGFGMAGCELRRQGEDGKLAVWNGLGRMKRPDILARWPASGDLPSQVLVADAKYKALGSPSALSPGDQYQLYAYSHLGHYEEPASKAAVLYPVQDDRNTAEHYSRGGVTPFELCVMGCPFPRDADLVSAQAWSGYLAQLGERLRQQFAPAKQDGKPSKAPEDRTGP